LLPRPLILLLPALALVVALIATQLPRWTAPLQTWFAPDTPGACAAVQSLKLYAGSRANLTGIGREAAQIRAEQLVAEYYDVVPLAVSEPLAVEATLPDESRRAYYVVTARLTDSAPPGSQANTAAVIYLDAETGDPRALITATNDPAADCDFDVRRALVAALKSPPLLLLFAYIALAAAAPGIRRIAKGRNRP
jgi:hypothetical protein